MGKTLQLLEYIEQNGKDKTWRELASQFGFGSEDAVRKAVKKHNKSPRPIQGETEQSETLEYNLGKGEVKVCHIWDHAPTPEEVIAHHKMDLSKWRLSNVWIKMVPKGYLTSALFSCKKAEEKFTTEFIEFLKHYKSPHNKIYPIISHNKDNSDGAIVINQQDAHWNKHDLGGENDILYRFEVYKKCLLNTVHSATATCNLKKAIYIIGSDAFNAEFTGMTTKGTPQQNLLSYNISFNLICKKQVEVINTLLSFIPEVEIVYLQGNHDEYVGFHMVSWLNAYYKAQSNLSIDMSMDCTKYLSVYDTALCINHGDAQKPERLAQNFPIQYKEGFSKANYWAILTGDKHTELSRSIGGIKFYQIPALSTAVSHWDQKMGYDLGRAEMTSFLITNGKGINHIIKEPIFKY